jgi:hypothetical protein
MNGFKLSPAAQIALCAEQARLERFPDWSQRELLCHPDEAHQLCDFVRNALKRHALSDHEILSAFVRAGRQNALAFLCPMRRRRAS